MSDAAAREGNNVVVRAFFFLLSLSLFDANTDTLPFSLSHFDCSC